MCTSVCMCICLLSVCAWCVNVCTRVYMYTYVCLVFVHGVCVCVYVRKCVYVCYLFVYVYVCIFLHVRILCGVCVLQGYDVYVCTRNLCTWTVYVHTIIIIIHKIKNTCTVTRLCT